MRGCRKIYKTLIHRIFGIKSPSLMLSICAYCEKSGSCKIGLQMRDYSAFLRSE